LEETAVSASSHLNISLIRNRLSQINAPMKTL
jgi:hypothetical protein